MKRSAGGRAMIVDGSGMIPDTIGVVMTYAGRHADTLSRTGRCSPDDLVLHREYPMAAAVALLRRQSPPWFELARSKRNGFSIDPAHYLPPMPVPYFPPDVPRLIQAWDSFFLPDYFTCRAVLAESAFSINSKARGVIHGNYDDYDLLSRQNSGLLAYFYDDDDVFDTELTRIVASMTTGDFDVLVSPLIRFHEDLFTFVRQGHETDILIGRRQDFHFRYQTNNYGLVGSRLSRERFIAMRDHVEASAYADSHRLVDRVISRPISATFKTIWSASMLPVIDRGKAAVLETMQNFSSRSASLRLPDDYRWLSSYLEQICALIRCVQSCHGENDLDSQLRRIRWSMGQPPAPQP